MGQYEASEVNLGDSKYICFEHSALLAVTLVQEDITI